MNSELKYPPLAQEVRKNIHETFRAIDQEIDYGKDDTIYEAGDRMRRLSDELTRWGHIAGELAAVWQKEYDRRTQIQMEDIPF